MLFPYLRILRPKHWVKNCFIFAPLIFSSNLFNEGLFEVVFSGFLTFCAMASSIYIFNDLVDADYDFKNPQKRMRPIASGEVFLPVAGGVAVILFFIALANAYLLDMKFLAIITLYAVLNILYTLKLKHEVILDVLIVSTGFVLRIMAGAILCNVPLSMWIILCTLFISLFIALCKRRSEIIMMESISDQPIILDKYNKAFVDQLIASSSAATILSYALYTLDIKTINSFGTKWLVFTTLFVIYGVYRYKYLHYKLDATNNPTDIVTSDKGIIINMVLWLLVLGILIYMK